MWLFEEKCFDEVPTDIIGFVYLITNEKTGKQYIGKKLFTSAKRKRVKGKTKKFRVESDWKEYFGSNKILVADVESLGEKNFTREILHLCKSRGTCNYLEAREQMDRRVLENPEFWYNEQVRVRCHRSHIKF